MSLLAQKKKITLTLMVLSIALSSIGIMIHALALPSGGSSPPTFIYRNGRWYDTWNVTRNAWYGEDGYLPQLANESLGINRETAYGWGQEFKVTYPDRVKRAQEILKFVQRWMKYGYDRDYVIMGGEAQIEWAWNADEMAYKIKEAQNSNSVARGDCEDFAFLCGIIYLGADFEVALVSPEGHVALLIWFPEYPNANIYWDIGDEKGYGWIWVEATGDKNLLGWTPPDFNNGRFDVYVIEDPLSLEIDQIRFDPLIPTANSDVTVTVQVKTAEAEINQVTLLYYIEGELDRNEEVMLQTSESTYRGTIPKQREGTSIHFYIQASDTFGRVVQSHESTYTVKRTILGLGVETVVLSLIVVGIILILLIRH